MTTNAWPAALQMRAEARWASYYAPFDFVNSEARVVLMGITPGLTQAMNALRSAQADIRAYRSAEEILKRAKEFASFSGPMRVNLTAMLDKIGIARLLRVASTSELFTSRTDLVHFTSVLRYPVTFDGENYGGNPGMLRAAFTRDELNRWVQDEIRLMPSAIYVPLGPSAAEALLWICERGLLNKTLVLTGLPHPSGANAERIAYFLGRKSRSNLSVKVDAEKIDRCRASLEAQVSVIAGSFQ